MNDFYTPPFLVKFLKSRGFIEGSEVRQKIEELKPLLDVDEWISFSKKDWNEFKKDLDFDTESQSDSGIKVEK